MCLTSDPYAEIIICPAAYAVSSYPGLSLAQDSMGRYTDTLSTNMDDTLADSLPRVSVQPDPPGPDPRYEGAAKSADVNNSDIFLFYFNHVTADGRGSGRSNPVFLKISLNHF
ncbi:MAG: hypothetical protein KL787_04780 [Taibaiella sp.]|nr:hypothetical protein [Taibaiella sp.]